MDIHARFPEWACVKQGSHTLQAFSFINIRECNNE